jgi:ankyrin repeat protein
MTIDITLIEGLTQDLQDMVLTNLSSDHIRMIGKDRVSDYIWNQKKDRTIMEAILNNNLIGLKYVIKSQNINKVSYLSLELSAMVGNLDIIKFLIDYYDVNNHSRVIACLLLSAIYGHLHIIKYLVEIYGGTYNIALEWAAKNGHLNIIQYLVKETVIDSYEEAVKQSAKNGHLHVVQFLVVQGANIYIENGIVFQLSAGHLEVLKYLIGDAFEYCGEALVQAANNDHIEVVQYLVKHGVTLRCDGLNDILEKRIINYLINNARVDSNTMIRWKIASSNVEFNNILNGNDDYKNIALHIYAEKGNLDAVQWLIANDADVNAYSSIALQASAKNNHLLVADYLINHGARIHEQNDRALTLSVENGHLSMVKYLIKRGYETLITETNTRNLILRIAASNGHLDIVKYMIDFIQDIYGFSDMIYGMNDVVQGASAYAIRYAIEAGQIEIIKYLINKAADDYSVALAARNGDLKIMRFLVSQGINIYANCEGGLREAAKNGCLPMVEYLVDMGADVNQYYTFENDYLYEEDWSDIDSEYDILEWGSERGNFEIAEFLVDNKDDIYKNWNDALRSSSTNIRLHIEKYLADDESDLALDTTMYTSLEWASKYGHLEVVKYLIKNSTNTDNTEAIELAARYGHLEVVKCLTKTDYCSLYEAKELAKKYGHIKIFNYLSNEIH